MKTLKQITTAKIYADEKVLATAPRNKVQGELVFFNLGKYVTDDELEKEYESRNLVPADLYALANWNEENKDDERTYFATHWKDAKGKWCYAAFDRWFDERVVHVNRYGHEWLDFWWFAGVSKSSTKNSVAKPSHSEPLNLELAIQIVKEAGYQIAKII